MLSPSVNEFEHVSSVSMFISITYILFLLIYNVINYKCFEMVTNIKYFILEYKEKF